MPASAHSVFEANELEIHVINDEGTDAIEPYGGYDITEVFVGFAHDASVGQDAAGDGFYVRLELYGDRNEAFVPALDAEWSVAVTFEMDGAPFTRSLRTTDGTTFAGDFDSLLVQVEGRDTHILRAFVAYEKLGVAPGQILKVTQVESRVDGDLRDVAPGGIPVPGTNGAAMYPDATAIPGRGILVESITLVAPDGYVRIRLQAPAEGVYEITVQSALAKGGQHIFIRPAATEGWTYAVNGTSAGEVAANGTLTFRLEATPSGATDALRMNILTDVGGRSQLILDVDGTISAPGGVSAKPTPQTPVESPAGGLIAVSFGLLLGAGILRRRAND